MLERGTKLRVLLELTRIILLFTILGSLGWVLIDQIYTLNETAVPYQWLGGAANILFIFVRYRNRWQFSGWYKGIGRKQLSVKTSRFLLAIALGLFISPFLLSYFLE